MGLTNRPSFFLRSTSLRSGLRSPASTLAWSALAALTAASLGAGCGRTGAWDDTTAVAPGPVACGNGVCDGGETCASCSPDCGLCAGCGDGVCSASENCANCVQDCGRCQGCGDGACDEDTEACASCPIDCGTCAGCGDGVCSASENCLSCPGDCSTCAGCGDGFCSPPEDCLSCAPDCGVCEACGNGVCSPATEGCFSCPADCGACLSCGDGSCSGTETCASCQRDCGVCSVCPNGVCESFETCSICPQDCGQCEPKGCLEIVSCTFQCVDLTQMPPAFSLTCVASCVSLGCADVQFFVDQVLRCAVEALPGCGGDFACVQETCGSEIAACIGAAC